MPLTYVDLFAGIGGLSLGLERAGMRCVGQVEIDPFCRRVLAKHWPDVPKVSDAESFNGGEFGPFDILAAGFPCQPVSQNGRKKAQDDARWLWPIVARIVRHVRPRGVLLENVAGLLDRGIDEVLGDLAACGYDAEWDCVPAAALGAEHLRERVFIFAYPAGAGPQGEVSAGRVWGRGLLAQRDRWSSAPRLRGEPDGVPDWVDRLRGLGNAVVPQVAEYIGRLIVQAHADHGRDLNHGRAGRPTTVNPHARVDKF